MRRTFTLALIAIAGLIAMLPHTSHAGNSGYRITDARGQQTNLMLTSDGANSAICAWQDDRTGTSLIYAQRFDSLGVKHWAADGIPITTTGTQVSLRHVLTDSLGGAWVVYTSFVGTQATLRAQHVDASGICTANGAAAIVSGRPATGYADIGSSFATVSRPGTLQCLYQYNLESHWHWSLASLLSSGATEWSRLDGSKSTFDMLFGGDVCPDGRGGIFVLTSGQIYPQNGTYVQHFDSLGNPRWPNGGLLSDNSPAGIAARIVRRTNGSAYLAYPLSPGNNSGTIGFNVVSADSGLRFPPNSPRISFGYYAKPCMAHDADGISAVIMNNSGTWNLCRIGDDGTILRTSPLPPTTVDMSYWGSPRTISTTATSSRDQIAWLDARDPGDLFVQQYSQDGVPLLALGGTPIRQAPGDPTNLETVTLGTRLMVAWNDPRRPNDSDIYAQIMNADGSLLLDDADAPRISAVSDVRNDQGGHLSVTWQRSAYDDAGIRSITSYRIWRRLPTTATTLQSEQASAALRGGIRATARSGAVEYWEAVAELPAQQLRGYGAVVATTQDSLPGSNPYTAFFVSALTANPFVFYDSPVDSGYSVDNLPPRAPLFAGARYEAGQNHLHWLPNTEADLNGYILYRGTSPDFVVDVTDPVAFVSDTGYVDAANGPMYYKIAAVDRHGNRSPYITVLPTGNAGVGGGGLSLAFSLARPFPNPSDGSSLNVEFTLPTAAPATFEVLDVSGRCVLRDDLADYAAGRHAIDIAKRVRLASGLYLVRLQQAGMTRSIRATVLQ